MLQQPFPSCSFDIVLSYNVLYHGRRDRFAEAIALVWQLLKSGGPFFFTCPSREDGKYGHGERVAPHTFIATSSVSETPGDIHHFASRADLDSLLLDFKIHSIQKKRSVEP